MSETLFEPPDIAQDWLEAMVSGNFETAWTQTDRIELPRRAGRSPQNHPSHLVWDGTPFDGRSVHVRCEHGLGDSIQFLRYLPRLRERARSVTVSVQPPLLDLARVFRGMATVRNGWDDVPAPAHEVEIECMEFPYAFRDDLTSIPATTPYLDVARIRALRRGKALAGIKRFASGNHLVSEPVGFTAQRSVSPTRPALESAGLHILQFAAGNR